MTKADLIAAVAAENALSRKATHDVVNALFDAIIGAVRRDGGFTVAGLGTFTARARGVRFRAAPQLKKGL